MKKHFVSGAAILAIASAAGLWACSSDKTKDADASSPATAPSNSSGTTQNSNESMDTTTQSAPATTSDSGNLSTASSTNPSGSSADAARMEAQPAADDTSSSDQSKDYEKSSRK